jgi:hypothetical protein
MKERPGHRNRAALSPRYDADMGVDVCAPFGVARVLSRSVTEDEVFADARLADSTEWADLRLRAQAARAVSRALREVSHDLRRGQAVRDASGNESPRLREVGPATAAAASGRRHRDPLQRQILCRAINEEMHRYSRNAAIDEVEIEIVCECAREGCFMLIRVSPGDYERTRSCGARFLVKDSHVAGDLILSSSRGVAIVRKFGDEARAATRTDPRCRHDANRSATANAEVGLLGVG